MLAAEALRYARVMRATLYFWTFALTLQAFIQPALVAGPATSVFWFFFAARRFFEQA